MRTLALLLAVAALAPAQEAPAPEPRVAVDPGWQAVERLLRAPDDPAAVEKLEPFFQRVARDEQAARKALGARYGTVRPVTIKVQGKKPAEILAEIVKQGGLEVDTTYSLQRQPGEPLDLAVEDLTPLGALREFCAATKLTPSTSAGRGPIFLHQGGGEIGPGMAFRNFLVTHAVTSRNLVLDFAGPPSKGLLVSFNLLWDPGLDVIDVRDEVEVLEAVDDKGRALGRAPEAYVAAQRRSAEASGRSGWLGLRNPQLLLAAPEPDAAAIARIRGRAVALLSAEASSLVLDKVDEGPQSGENDAFRARADASGDRMGQSSVQVRITPKGMTPAEFLARPLQLKVRIGSLGERSCTARVRVEGGEVVLEGQPAYHPADWQGARPGERNITGVTVTLHTRCLERNAWFELAGLPLK